MIGLLNHLNIFIVKQNQFYMWKCKKCNSEVEDNFDICWNCNADKAGNDSNDLEIKKVANNIKADIAKSAEMRYPALRTISFLFKILSYVVFGLTIIALFIEANRNYSDGLSIILTFVIGLLLGMILLALSESIIVLVDIEANTRKTSNRSN